ncbi:MAG TPA: histidine phosphatase family protein [Ilumatobacteraceae bacterium]|nr:histidine phosphatase family protein [Ilumatobacteraceae bacterium]
MELVLIRHGEPEWVRDGLNVVDPPLTDRGLRQAECVARALDGEDFDEIVISPLRRPRLTAAPLLAKLGADEVIEAFLEEIREPNWHGTPAELAKKAYEEERSRAASARWEGIVGGEASRDFVERVRAGANEFLAARGVYRTKQILPVWHMDQSARRIAIFAHAGTNGVLLCHLLGLDPVPWEWDRFVTGHASITRLVSIELGDGHTFSLTKLSDVEHLPVDDRTGMAGLDPGAAHPLDAVDERAL